MYWVLRSFQLTSDPATCCGQGQYHTGTSWTRLGLSWICWYFLKENLKVHYVFILLLAESCSWMLLLEFEIVCANVKINSCSVVRYMNTVSGFQYHFPYLTRTTILMIIIWVKSDDRFIVVWPQHARTPPHFPDWADQPNMAQYGHKYAHELSPISIKSIMTPLHSLRRSHIVPTTSNLFIRKCLLTTPSNICLITSSKLSRT